MLAAIVLQHRLKTGKYLRAGELYFVGNLQYIVIKTIYYNYISNEIDRAELG